MAHQSLYRRYRPRRFSEIKGQEHVVAALRNAVSDDTAGHAYLFSGPRGTGKTSTARILAKALNCTNLTDGEPCCECDSCVAMEAGSSFDLFELDAASNRGVDSVRELVERTAVGSPGRTKVYILDEVHMLTKEASNALLKTLEEPPEHVRFVLATTDPQKVLPTIRSRTQHFDFHLLSAAELTDHVRWVVADAGLDVDEEAIAYAVRRGRGSVRDTLSALDQVVAAGGVTQRVEPVEALFEAVAANDSGKAMLAVADAVNAGHDPRVLAEAFVGEVRDAFLTSLGVDTPHLVDTDAERLSHWANELGAARLTATLERVGTALVDMRVAADPRVPLEVALVQLTAGPTGEATSTGATSAGAGASRASGADEAVIAALTKRIDELEQRVGDTTGPARSTAKPPTTADPPSTTADPPSPPGNSDGGPDPSTGAAAARAALADAREVSGRRKPPPPPPRRRGGAPSRPSRAEASQPQPAPGAPAQGEPAQAAPAETPPAATPPAETPPAEATPKSAASNAAASTPDPAPQPPPPTDSQTDSGSADPGSVDSAPTARSTPDREALVMAFGDQVVPQLKGIAKAVFSAGRFVSVEGGTAIFALDNEPTRDRADKYRPEVERLLSEHFGTTIGLALVAESDPRAQASSAPSSAPSASAPADPAPPAPAPPDPAPPDPAPPDPAPSSTAQPAASPSDSQSSSSPMADVATTPDPEEQLTAPVHELEDADIAATGVDRVAAAFPGAELIETENPK